MSQNFKGLEIFKDPKIVVNILDEIFEEKDKRI